MSPPDPETKKAGPPAKENTACNSVHKVTGAVNGVTKYEPIEEFKLTPADEQKMWATVPRCEEAYHSDKKTAFADGKVVSSVDPYDDPCFGGDEIESPPSDQRTEEQLEVAACRLISAVVEEASHAAEPTRKQLWVTMVAALHVRGFFANTTSARDLAFRLGTNHETFYQRCRRMEDRFATGLEKQPAGPPPSGAGPKSTGSKFNAENRHRVRRGRSQVFPLGGVAAICGEGGASHNDVCKAIIATAGRSPPLSWSTAKRYLDRACGVGAVENRGGRYYRAAQSCTAPQSAMGAA